MNWKVALVWFVFASMLTTSAITLGRFLSSSTSSSSKVNTDTVVDEDRVHFFFPLTVAKAKTSSFLNGLILTDLKAGDGAVLVATESISFRHSTGSSASFLAIQLPVGLSVGDDIPVSVPAPGSSNSVSDFYLKPGEAIVYRTSVPLVWRGTGKSKSRDIGTIEIVGIGPDELVCDVSFAMLFYEKGSEDTGEPYVRSERIMFPIASRAESRGLVVFPTF